MSRGMRRPPPDRHSIISSMGLPPRERERDLEPHSPTYYPNGARRSRQNSIATRRSDRSYSIRRDPRDPDDPEDDLDYDRGLPPRRFDSEPLRGERDFDRRRSRDDPAARRRFNSTNSRSSERVNVPARARTSSQRPSIPLFREDYEDEDEEEFEEQRRRRQSRDLRDSRPQEDLPPRPISRSERGGSGADAARGSERGGKAHRREMSDPINSPEPFEEFSNARASTQIPRDRRDDRERSANVRRIANGKPSSYADRDAKAHDLIDQERRGGSTKGSGGGMLSRMLSLSSSGRSKDSQAAGAGMSRSASSRLVRYNNKMPSGRRDERDEDLSRIEEEEMMMARERRRSISTRPGRVFDESDPRWFKGDRESIARERAERERERQREQERDDRDRESDRRRNRPRPRSTRPPPKQSTDLERSASAVRRSMDRERKRTLEALERTERGPSSRTAAVNRRESAAPSKATKAAALAAVTGVSAGAVAASVGKKNGTKASAQKQDPETEEESSDDHELVDAAAEPADVHDDEAKPLVLGKTAKAPEPAAKIPETTSDDESEEDDASDEDVHSTEQTSDGQDDVVKPAPAIADASTTTATPTKLVAVPNGSAAAPRGYKDFKPSSKTTSTSATEAKRKVEEDIEEASEESDESEEDKGDEGVEESEVKNDKKSSAGRSTAAAASAALVGGVAGGSALARGASRKSILSKASEAEQVESKKEERRMAKLQALEQQKAAEERAAAERADKAAARRRAKEEAAAAALAAKEAKRNEKVQKKEAKKADLDRQRREESEARDKAIREREEAEAQRLLAIRDKEREREEKAEARRQSRRRPHGASGPNVRSGGVKPLTPQQRHYLLKALVMLQMQSEWAEVEKLGALTEYGYPFSSQRSKLTRVKTVDRGEDGEYAKSARDPYANDDMMRETENLQEPLILRHLFHVHLHSFPGLDLAPEKYWQKRIQPFFDEMAARNFSTSIERGEISKRRLYALAATRYLGSFVARGFGVRGEGETRGPGIGDPGTEKWGVGKQWGKGTVKRGLDKPERIDDDLMARIDELYEGQGGRVWKLAGKEWHKVRGDWCAFKESIIESETGLEEVVSYLDISNIKNLPPHYKNSVEFARIHAAYIFHALFVTAPNADDLYKMVKGIHALAPYWGAKQLLKYANAETMISGILSLLLARPGGAKSLIQRIFSYVIGKEASWIQKEFVVPLRKEIDDAELTKKIEDYVKRGDRVESRRLQEQARKRGEDVLTTILLSAEPKLSEDAEAHVLELQRCFALSPYRGDLGLAYPETTPVGADRPPMPSWGAQGAEHTRARKFALLKLLLRESLKRRDREQAVEFASGSLIPAIIKDSLETVFYPTIREIASHANLSERLGDLQKFIDDLLETKKNKDDSIEAWIALAARHEQSLYMLFHECASIAKPLWDWCQLGLDYMALSTTDPAHPADRSAPNLEINFEELLQDARLTDADVKKILAEADRLARYTRWMKVRYELEMRKNYLLARPEASHPGGVSEADLPDAAMKKDIQDIDGMMRDLMEEMGETPDDGVCDDGVRGTEKYDFPWAFYDAIDPLNQHLPAEEEAGVLKVSNPGVNYPPPSLKHIRKLQPLFCELLASKLPEWQSEDVLGQLGALNKTVPRSNLSKLSLKPRKARTSFSEGSLAVPSANPASETKSMMSSTSRLSRLRLPSLFGRK